jgi:hypothetical protein
VAGANASCEFTIASPDFVTQQATVVDWGGGTPGTLTLSDDCGGRFGISNQATGSLLGFWMAPVAGDLCILTAHATNGDGLTGTISAAVLADAGAPPAPTQLPTHSGLLVVSVDPHNQLNIQLSNPPPAVTALAPGLAMAFSDFVGWADGLPGIVTVTDSCVGPQPVSIFGFGFTDASTPFWTIPSTPGTLCTVTAQATNLQGVASQVSAQYRIASP